MILNRVQKKYLNVFLVTGTLIFFGCDMQYNRIEQKDPNPGSDYVYGDINGPARQTLNQYEASMDDIARANRIREKLFNNTVGVAPTRADTNGTATTNENLQGTTVITDGGNNTNQTNNGSN